MGWLMILGWLSTACHADPVKPRISLAGRELALAFDVWSSGGKCAAADLIRGKGRRIWGVVYEIPNVLLSRETAIGRKSLDEIEGEGSNYTRSKIMLRWRNGRRIKAPVLTYVGLSRRSGIPTSQEYVAHILAGLTEHRIPKGYVGYVKSCISANNSELGKVL